MSDRLDAQDLRLRFVEADAVMLHEESDPARVERLTKAVTSDGFLRNPPIAACMDNGVWVVLDGATRTTTLKHLGAKHILVQSVSYADASVSLGAWYHVLPTNAAIEADRFAGLYEAEVVRTHTVEAARSMLDCRDGIAALVHEGGNCSVFRLPSTSFGSPNAVLRALVAVYGGAGEIYRIVHDDLMDIVRREEARSEVVMFPSFTPAEIQRAAITQDVLPAGITRHLISGRVLNLNVELDTILRVESLDEKNAWLSAWLTKMILTKKVRYYHEPVFVFDD